MNATEREQERPVTAWGIDMDKLPADIRGIGGGNSYPNPYAVVRYISLTADPSGDGWNLHTVGMKGRGLGRFHTIIYLPKAAAVAAAALLTRGLRDELSELITRADGHVLLDRGERLRRTVRGFGFCDWEVTK